MKGFEKAWAMVAVAVLTFAYTAWDDGMTPAEIVLTVSVFVGAASTYVFDNIATGVGRYAKGIAAFLMPALGVVAAQIMDGLTPQEWIEAILAGAAGVGLVVGIGNRGYVFATKSRVFTP